MTAANSRAFWDFAEKDWLREKKISNAAGIMARPPCLVPVALNGKDLALEASAPPRLAAGPFSGDLLYFAFGDAGLCVINSIAI